MASTRQAQDDGTSKEATSGGAADHGNHVQAAQPVYKRLLYGAAVSSIQNLVVGPAMSFRHLKQRLMPPDTYPTEIKTYKERPRLPVHLFFPKSYDRSSPRPLPLLLSIHGGGFVVGDPSDNDLWNSRFSEVHSALVVGLNYAKAPGNPFPGPRRDLEVLIGAIFDDAELRPHIDTAKVGVMGFSAGGSLTMTVSQSPAVRDRVTAGIVPIYPVTDLSLDPAQKAETRRYKPGLGGTRGSMKDALLPAAPLFDWSYIPAGQDLRDPLLSAYFAPREAFPKRVWIVGCELDMLGHEAWRAACKLAGRAVPDLSQRIGQEEPADGGKPGTLITEGDERFAWEDKNGNGDGEIKWLCVADAMHGFDMAAVMRADETTVQDGDLKREALIKMTGEWLFQTDK